MVIMTRARLNLVLEKTCFTNLCAWSEEASVHDVFNIYGHMFFNQVL